jgi:hypothetical protein
LSQRLIFWQMTSCLIEKKNENQSPNEQARVPAQKYKTVVRQINPNARAITKEPFVPQT